MVSGFINFIIALYQRRQLIFEMARRDIMTQYIGSSLGFFWTFINPLMMILIMWFVFTFGFNSTPKGNVPFLVWLTAGMSIWNTFAEVLNGSTAVFQQNSHLVKKVVFPLSILPIVKLVASFVSHFIFLIILLCLVLLYKLPFSLYWFQGLYYYAAMCVFLLGLCWLTASINIFVKDTGQIVNVALQIGFWASPIFWDMETLPEKIQMLFRLNPMFYIIQGYRESFLYFVPFWQHPLLSVYFWLSAFFAFAIGAIVFLRLRPHFADVL
jgi:lipopolysaccharide transport system permease protein/teichoic acid transport system permease protein